MTRDLLPALPLPLIAVCLPAYLRYLDKLFSIAGVLYANHDLQE